MTFVPTQDLDPDQSVMALDEFRVSQVSIADVGVRTGLSLPPVMGQPGVLSVDLADEGVRAPLSEASEIYW